MAGDADLHTSKNSSLKNGAKFSDFRTGQDRRRTGIIGRFEADGAGTFYRNSMPAPIAGSAPGVNTFARTGGRGQGVNFFTYGQNVKKGDQDFLSGVSRANVGGVEAGSQNDTFSGGSTIAGFTTHISKGMSQYSDYGADTGAIGKTADASYYRSGGGAAFDTERYANYMANMVGTQSAEGLASAGQGVLSNSRTGVE